MVREGTPAACSLPVAGRLPLSGQGGIIPRMARHPSTPDCKIKGCTRADSGSGLCTMHHKMVPLAMGQACAGEIMISSHRIALKHHRLMVKHVQQLLSEQASA